GSNFCSRLDWCVCKARPRSSNRAPDKAVLNKRSGRGFFERWVTRTMSGRCSDWVKCASVSRPAIKRRNCLKCRCGCWALRDCWWREQSAFADCALPRSAWRFNNLRPANHPERRLALAGHWLVEHQLPNRIEKWCTKQIAEKELLTSLLEAFQVESDEFWSFHWTLGSKRLKTGQPMIGPTRVTDLAVNVVLPWLWMRAVEGK